MLWAFAGCKMHDMAAAAINIRLDATLKSYYL